MRNTEYGVFCDNLSLLRSRAISQMTSKNLGCVRVILKNNKKQGIKAGRAQTRSVCLRLAK